MILGQKILNLHRQGAGPIAVKVLLDAKAMVIGESGIQSLIRKLLVSFEANESRQELAVLAAVGSSRWAICVPHLVHLCQAARQSLIVQRDRVTAQRERHAEAFTRLELERSLTHEST